ncbi:MAG TPA: hypothetical protein VEU76_06275 [Candidatus Udaeobacter sp.]|nr:hypothetical protein [Candidatus Udaeobacter sp.]
MGVAIVAAAIQANGPVRDLLFLPMVLLIGLFSSWRERKQLAYSRSSTVAFWAICGIYLVWGAIVTWTSNVIGWTGQTSDWHGVVMVFVMVLPLLIGAWLIGRR